MDQPSKVQQFDNPTEDYVDNLYRITRHNQPLKILNSVYSERIMSDKPSAAWYLAPIFLGIIVSAIMWYVLKDEDHPDSPKMVKKGWVIGIVLTLISIAWIPVRLMSMMVLDVDKQMGDHMRLIPDEMKQMVPP